MTVLKEPTPARPTSSQHRTSLSSTASSLPSKSRIHSHSLSVGSINPAHRVGRRKSMSSTSRANLRLQGPTLQHTDMPNSLPNNGSIYNETAVADGPMLASMPETEKVNNKARLRRASEGSHLKANKRLVSGSDLKCEKCGKGYKHSSCLTKHLWEHTPEWQYTSKLLISKHQQVQLLEAASVLVAMNQEGESGNSDHSSASPAASGSSDLRDDELSSTDTTPPPQPDEVIGSYSTSRSNSGRSKRFSATSSAYSQSYQSTSAFSDVGQNHSSHYRQWSNDGRPTTSGTSVAGSNYDDEDQADLAAAVGLLSCSYGTPKSGPAALGFDVPPVPPLPARFLGMNKDVDMHNEGLEDMDEFDEHSPARDHRMDEDDDGVFGTMEY
ncbi:uncharacterized protein BDZ99DRAFT_511180 [Mytilinidion resinicola]|uniref:C2H2-type domain-containing protein n=1 Tax=Mytilinidion resinicola TaxID=574789 RepID=A0A6A6Y940_9PEZI|nr:uncharacterized protein BDZ99DRAFT_511180 [Mytilinidion resinicola]KAF2805063.1 hypothetical protein BDZ99DRAFT_511180 [Mytilinidion resinicola]